MSKKEKPNITDNISREGSAETDRIREGYNLPETYFNIEVEKASKRKDIITVLELEQLTGSRFERFYVETDEVRGAYTISSLEQLLKNPLTPYKKLLFSGFTGSGKTTELVKLYYQLLEDFNIIIFSAWNKLKINEITIEAVLFEIVEDVLNYLSYRNLWQEGDESLNKIIDGITHWCSETRIIDEKASEKSKSLGIGIDFLKGIFGKAKVESKYSGSTTEKTTRIEERKINDLIFECNKIFDYIKEKTGKDTIIIIDDLEKMSFTKAKQFYVDNSSFIRDFHCKMLMTIPVELVYHPDFAIIQNVFDEAEVLPMIKIKDKEGDEYPPGVDILIEILKKRLNLSLFEKECYKEAIKYSGGAIRELFRIIRKAALIEKSDIITAASMRKSISQNKDMFGARIQEHGEVKFEDYLDVLFDIKYGNKRTPEKNIALLDLLRTRAVMKYNEEGFYDTHPLLDDFIEDYWKKKQKNGKTRQG